MHLHEKLIKTKKTAKMFRHTSLYKKLLFNRFLKSFDFVKNCDPFWEIQRYILKYNLTISRSLN